jgi:hypothetical protein
MPNVGTPGVRAAWDVFISHASEDKDQFVRPLAFAMSRLGLRVWYDEFSLRPGDSLSESIDRGLAESEFGLVVISPDFMRKRWPRRELAGLVAGELGREQVVLPLWYRVVAEDVLRFSPTLADKKAILAGTEPDFRRLSLQVVERVKPELHTALHRRAAYERRMAESTPVKVRIDEIRTDAPIRHEQVSLAFGIRLRLVRETLLEVLPVSWRETVDNFRRDLTPDRELELWEMIASVYQTIVNEFELDQEGKRQVFRAVFSHLSFGESEWPDREWSGRTRELCGAEIDPVDENFGSITRPV